MRVQKITKIAVISDIHANADALNMVLQEVESMEIDTTVFLGDILTYGCQPLEVLELLNHYRNHNFCIFIKGNHDQLYFDLQSQDQKSDYEIPDFVQESANWTLNQILGLKFEDYFLWRESYVFANIYFSHSNPFIYGDWSYLEDHNSLEKAFQELNSKNLFSGIFGHSHRKTLVSKEEGAIKRLDGNFANIDKIDQLIVNVGSAGQPRGTGLSYALLEIKNNKLFKVQLNEVEVCLKNSINLIKKAKFSSDTERLLLSFLEGFN